VGGGADLNLVWDPLAASGIPELALERQDNGDLVRRYLSGPLGAVSMENPSETFYYHQDPLGTVTDLTDEDGDPQWRYTYEAYGAQLTATNVSGTAPENRLRYTGQYLDPETTLYHLRTRQYDPAIGRFGALDPVEPPTASAFDGAYVYVNGRPTALVDPLGLYGWKELKKDAAGAMDAVAVVGDFRSHQEFWADWARRGAQRGGILGNAQMGVAWGADFLISPFAQIQAGTETLWDPCASGWDKTKALGSIGLGIASVLPFGRFGAAAAAKGGSKLVEGARYPLSPKIQGQLAKRGWTTEAIDEAVQSGKQVRAVNKATGNPATRYIHPTTGQSVVIDDVTGQVIHVGGPGFKYGPGSGDVP
jgi:RHS repeat-associated protein